MMELLGKALEYHSTLIDLEQRLHVVTSSTQQESGNGRITPNHTDPIVLPETKAEMPKDDDLLAVTQVEGEEGEEGEEPIVTRATPAKNDELKLCKLA